MIRLLLVKELWDLRGVLAISSLGYLFWLYQFTHMTLPEWRKFQNPHSLPFEPDGFVQSLIVYGSVVAAFLGLYQGMADTSSPRLQFLLSRPITWTQLVLSRTVIGLGLWATGCFGTLFAAIVISIYFPICPAPLESWMLTDCLGWLAMGTTIYLGGFLSAMHSGAWLGTRLFPLFGAIGWWYFVLFPLMLNQYKFSALSLFAGNQIIFLATLAITNFILFLPIVFYSQLPADSPPTSFRTPWTKAIKVLASFGMAFVLAVGFFSLVVLGYSFFGRSFPRSTQEIIHVQHKRESLRFSPDGKPIIFRFDQFLLGPVPTDERALMVVRKIEADAKANNPTLSTGKSPLATGFYSFEFLERSRNELYDHLQLINQGSSGIWSKLYYLYLNCKHPDEILPMAVSTNETEFWYLFLHKYPLPHAYFTGYSFLSQAHLGFIGKNGLQPHQPSLSESFHLSAFEQSVANPLSEELTGREHSFPIINWNHRRAPRDMPAEVPYGPVWLATDDGIAECNLADRSVTLISNLKGIKKLAYFYDHEKGSYFPIAITNNQVQVFEPGGKLLAKANFSVDFYKNNSFFLTNQNDFIVVEDDYDQSKYLHPEPEDHVDIFWFQKNGELKESKKMVLNVAAKTVTGSSSVPIVQPMFLFELVSGLSGVVLDFFVDRRNAREVADNYIQRYFPWMAAASLTSMALCFWRERRHGEGWSQTFAWLAFVALFGVSGWFGYRFHKRWPLLIPCKSCARTRPINQELCPHCQAAFAKPTHRIAPIIAPSVASLPLEPQTT